MAAMFKLTFAAAPDPPLVLSSTTTMSFPALVGALGVRTIAPVPEPGDSATNVSVLDSVPSGFCTCTERFPADCRSAAASDVVHWVLDAQKVARGVPATRIVEPGPGADGEKLIPEASSVKPPAEPAYALVGESENMSGPPIIVTVADPDWVASAELVATTAIRAGEGTAAGAVYSPVESIDPQTPARMHPVPVIDQVTC
jgi:hypothetical protein